MSWEFRSNEPIYLQIVAIMRGRIAAGIYSPGDKLPSVREMALDAGVNPNTMQRALAALEQEGLVHAQRTAGRFVTEDADALALVRQTLAQGEVDRLISRLLKLGFNKEGILKMVALRLEQSPTGSAPQSGDE